MYQPQPAAFLRGPISSSRARVRPTEKNEDPGKLIDPFGGLPPRNVRAKQAPAKVQKHHVNKTKRKVNTNAERNKPQNEASVLIDPFG